MAHGTKMESLWISPKVGLARLLINEVWHAIYQSNYNAEARLEESKPCLH